MPVPLYCKGTTDIDSSKVAFATDGLLSVQTDEEHGAVELGNVDEVGVYTDGESLPSTEPIMLVCTGTDIAFVAGDTIDIDGTFGLTDVIGTRTVTIEDDVSEEFTWYLDNQGVPYNDANLTDPVFDTVINVVDSLHFSDAIPSSGDDYISQEVLDLDEESDYGNYNADQEDIYFNDIQDIGNTFFWEEVFKFSDDLDISSFLDSLEECRFNEDIVLDRFLEMLEEVKISEILEYDTIQNIVESMAFQELFRTSSLFTKVTGYTKEWNKSK